MRAHLLGLLLVVAACSRGGGGGDDGKPTTFTHDDPAFAIDLPAGFEAQPVADDALGGGKTIRFAGKRAAFGLSVDWAPEQHGQSAAEARTGWRQLAEVAQPNDEILAEGDLPAGGGVWIETDRLGGTVISWLRVSDQMVECLASGGGAREVPASLLAACKSLRPAP